jgi:PAS domain S-box-containing protein
MAKSVLNKESLTILFVLGIIVLISASILAYMKTNDKIEDNDFIIDAFRRKELMDNLYTAVTDVETSRRGYFVTGDKEYVDQFYSNASKADTLVKRLRSTMFQSQKQLARSDTLITLVKDRVATLEEGIRLQNAKGTDVKQHKNMFDRGRIIQFNIRKILNNMKFEEEKTLLANKNRAEQSYQFTYYTLLGGIGMSIIIFIVVFAVLRKKASHVFALENQDISREELEQIVKERTAEISQINQKLYAKFGELERSDAALKRSEQYYRMLFEQAHDAIIIFSPDDQKVLDVNRRACDLYGIKRDEFIGFSLDAISKNIPYGADNVKYTLQKGYYHNFQSVHYKKDSTEMLMEINASVISYKGKPAILSINRDITDRILKVV